MMIVALAMSASAGDLIDSQYRLPELKQLKASLNASDACRDAKLPGACKGAGESVRFSLPAVSFLLGSAELPDSLTRQLDVLAEALGERNAATGGLRIEAHTDASGSPQENRMLSQRRADAVKAYLVRRGVNAALLQAVGMGSSAPKLHDDPFAAENRRVEIVRL